MHIVFIAGINDSLPELTAALNGKLCRQLLVNICIERPVTTSRVFLVSFKPLTNLLQEF